MLTYPSVSPPPQQAIVAATASGESGTNLILLIDGGQVVIPTAPERSYVARLLLGYRKKDMPESIHIAAYLARDHGGQARLVGDSFVADMVWWVNCLPTITDLDLSESQVTGACSSSIAAMPNLRSVSFESTAVRDSDLDDFALMKQLRRLDLQSTDWTADGIAKLTHRLPQCVIIHESTWQTPR